MPVNTWEIEDMNRAQRRLSKKKEPKYNLSKTEVKSLARKALANDVDNLKKEIYEEARIEFMLGALVLPMIVLMDNFWTKRYRKKIRRFTELMLEYYQDWEEGIITSEKMAEHLWEYGGIRLERNREDEE